MREKIIFDGLIDSSIASIEKDIHLYYDELTLVGPLMELSFETVETKLVWIVTPENSANNQKLINGYTELIRVSLEFDTCTRVKIISCREELDLFYFQLSYRIQGKYLLPMLTSYAITVPWHELVEEGLVQAPKNEILDVIYKPADPDDTAKRYGTDRDLTKNDIRNAIKACEEWQNRGQSMFSFFYDSGHWIATKCAYETFKKYCYDPKFK